MKRKQNYQYFISITISLLVSMGVFLFEIKELNLTIEKNWSRLLSDSFFVSSILFISVFLLSWISNDGFFDIFSYSFKRFGARIFRKNPKYTNVPKTFYEYRVLKHEGEPASIQYLAWVGLANLVLGILFFIFHISGIGNVA